MQWSRHHVVLDRSVVITVCSSLPVQCSFPSLSKQTNNSIAKLTIRLNLKTQPNPHFAL